MLQVVSPSCTLSVYASSGLAILQPVSVCFKWSRHPAPCQCMLQVVSPSCTLLVFASSGLAT
ncbi:hypothetical protein DPMN_100646 [Dreissena polymorpha]|uniref:Uncharacterized protein n=1 Tax=Dreissena polymorpha TaxID=45954 RepID=A0A9D4LHA4_DREPO|nr:hypothetical protein DPMN_100644 [Dreissena polymorpha]KAH3858027.1 hypothetical protein DPMN_100646 [Dreissena polymorpha]